MLSDIAKKNPWEPLAGKGEMFELISAFEWSQTSIGPREQWPSSLHTVVNLILATKFPMALLWGHDLILIYNDAYRVICLDRHPAALGRSPRDIWPEVWHINQPIFAAVMERGETFHFENKLFPINRHGCFEDAYFTLSYSPVRIEDGSIGGSLVVLEETTEVKKAEEALLRSQQQLKEAESIGQGGGWEFNIDTLEQKWTEEVYRIHEVDQDFEPTVEKGLAFYPPEARTS